MRRSLGRLGISGVLVTICIGPFKYVFRKFWIWARRFLLLGGPLLVGKRDYVHTDIHTYMHTYKGTATYTHTYAYAHTDTAQKDMHIQ